MHFDSKRLSTGSASKYRPLGAGGVGRQMEAIDEDGVTPNDLSDKPTSAGLRTFFRRDSGP